jgi:hypothetical protein
VVRVSHYGHTWGRRSGRVACYGNITESRLPLHRSFAVRLHAHAGVCMLPKGLGPRQPFPPSPEHCRAFLSPGRFEAEGGSCGEQCGGSGHLIQLSNPLGCSPGKRHGVSGSGHQYGGSTLGSTTLQISIAGTNPVASKGHLRSMASKGRAWITSSSISWPFSAVSRSFSAISRSFRSISRSFSSISWSFSAISRSFSSISRPFS